MTDPSLKTLDDAITEMEALLENPLGSNLEEKNQETSNSDGQGKNDTPTIFDLSLFRVLTDAQNSHGIPLQDYSQYHGYCSRRLERIRHHRDVRSSLVNNSKYQKKDGESTDAPVSSPGKKGKASQSSLHAYCGRPRVPDDGAISHEYTLWNLVFQAERAWSQACSLQNKPGPTKSKSKSRILSRLNKAVHWARALEDIVTKHKCVTPETQSEVQSYLMWMLGNQQLQRQEHAAAFRFYNSSRSILLDLASGKSKTTAASEATAEQLAVQDMWTNRADNLLLPLIRFCQYEARDEDLAGTDEALTRDGATDATPKKESGAITLEFRGQEIALDSYPKLAMLYLKLEKRLKKDGEEETTGKMSESDFLQFLADLDDALRWTVEESQRYSNLADGPAVQAKRRELSSLEAFFQYHKLALQRKHQEEGLVSENVFEADAAEMLHVYEALLQNAQAMVDLNQNEQVGSDDYNPEDDPYWLEAQAHVVRIRAVRCFQLARLYESPVWISGATTAQAMALLKQCSKLQRRAVEEVAACDFPNASEEEQYQTQLETLKTYLQAMMARVEASRYLESEEKSQDSSPGKTAVSSKATNRPLWLRLKDLDAGTVLADQDPSPITLPIPCKPVFYDVAWEQVTDTGGSLQVLDDFITSNEPKKTGGGGLFGWF